MHRRARFLAVLIVFIGTLVAVAPQANARSHRPQLPQGGRHILGHYRIVAYYGSGDGPALGILGSKSPDRIAAAIRKRARHWRGHGRKVQPAMELITTVAQAGAGPDGDYSQPVPASEVQRYVAAAHRHKMLLILDFQPGRAQFLTQVKLYAAFLRDPWVSVALDPEWKMTAHQVPGRVIGHTTAHAVNAVRHYLAGIVRHNNLPDKLLVVHQFTTGMIVHRARIKPSTGVEVYFHADGFGTPSQKRSTWNNLNFPGHRYGSGFKLFTKDDHPMMRPAQVLALNPRIDLITYQ